MCYTSVYDEIREIIEKNDDDHGDSLSIMPQCRLERGKQLEVTLFMG